MTRDVQLLPTFEEVKKQEEAEKSELIKMIKDAKSSSKLEEIRSKISHLHLHEDIKKILDSVISEKTVEIAAVEHIEAPSKDSPEIQNNPQNQDPNKEPNKEEDSVVGKVLDFVLSPLEEKPDLKTESLEKPIAPELETRFQIKDAPVFSEALVEYNAEFADKQKEGMKKSCYYSDQPENRDFFSKDGAIQKDESFLSLAGLPLDATEKDAERAYKKLSLKYHPDKNLDRSAEAVEIFQNIRESFSRFQEGAEIELNTEKWPQSHDEKSDQAPKDRKSKSSEALLGVLDDARQELSERSQSLVNISQNQTINTNLDSAIEQPQPQQSAKLEDSVVQAQEAVLNSLRQNNSKSGGENSGSVGVSAPTVKQTSSMHDID